MSAWQQCRELESISRQHLRKHLFPTMAFEGRYVHIEKGEMAREFQQTQGDYVFNSDDDSAHRIEHKCEYTRRHGNFFIETFSNRITGNPGWFWKLEADFLLYHFVKEGDVFLMNLRSLRRWLYSDSSDGKLRVHRYRHKVVGADQKNQTTGYCVKIEDVVAGINVQVKAVPPIIIPNREVAA